MIFWIGPAGALWSLANFGLAAEGWPQVAALHGVYRKQLFTGAGAPLARRWLRTRLTLASMGCGPRFVEQLPRFLFAASQDLFSPAPVGVWRKLTPAEPSNPRAALI